jgi:hypothetical protein
VLKAKSKAKADTVNCGSWLACDGISSVCLKNRVVCIAGKPAPTEKQIFSALDFAFAFNTQAGREAAVLLLLILI